MAAPRKSAQQLAAREKARKKAQELTERHERLIDLAAEFFEHEERAEQLRVEARERADAILAKAEQDAESAIADAGLKVRDMLATGESKASVAARLGVTTTELKKYLDVQDDVQLDAPTGEQSAATPAEPEKASGPEQNGKPSGTNAPATGQDAA